MSFRSLNAQAVAKFNSAESADLLEDIEIGLDRNASQKHDKIPSKSFAPSSLRCERRSWFRLRGVEPDQLRNPDKGLEFTAVLGTSIHEYLQKVISEQCKDSFEFVDVQEYIETVLDENYKCECSGYETRVQIDSPPIRFACDGILKMNDKFHLLEIKSCDHGTFADLTDPKDEHIDQFITYCTLLQLYGGFFLYVDRMYGDIKCYQYYVSDQDKQDRLNMFDRVMKYAEFNLAPDPLPKGDKWCSPSFCPYYKKCQQYGR